MLYRCEEWQGASKIWYCEHIGKISKGTQLWIVPARIMGISADNFLQQLVSDFHPDHIFYREDYTFVGYGWHKQSDMRKYKNFINALARKQNFQI